MKSLVPLLFFAISALAEDATLPGEITTPDPTLTNLAVEWRIGGDDNLNATCAVRYRKVGDPTWREEMPLFRVPAGASRGTSPIMTWTNRLSGSVFDLEPGTSYEIELTLDDPDGGRETKTVVASTRPEAVASGDAVIRNGAAADLNSVKPGEVLLLADGDYGAVTFNRDGEPGRPIVYRSTSGKAVFSEIGLTNRKWVYLEGITVNGPVRLNGTEHCVVRRCTITAPYGIKAYKPGMKNACIEDNVITGIRGWRPEIMGADGDNEGEGIQFTGSGNVIRHNRVEGFRDCISHMEDEGSASQQCNDILHNTVVKAGDGLSIYTSEPFDHARIEHNRFIGGKVPSGVSFGGYSPGRGRSIDVQRFGDHCVIDHNTYTVVGQAFEGKIGSRTFTTLPGTDFEKHGRIVEISAPFPEDPARRYDPPDLSSLNQAGAYAGEERVPDYGPR